MGGVDKTRQNSRNVLTGVNGAEEAIGASFLFCQVGVLAVVLRSVGKSSLHIDFFLYYFYFSLSLLSLWFLFLAPLKEISNM